jgi:hypothetical protein
MFRSDKHQRRQYPRSCSWHENLTALADKLYKPVAMICRERERERERERRRRYVSKSLERSNLKFRVTNIQM